MTRHHKHDSLTEDSINLLIEHGLAEGLPRIAELLLNAAMILERSAHMEPSRLRAVTNAPATPTE